MSQSPQKRRHGMLMRFCKADRKLLQLEQHSGLLLMMFFSGAVSAEYAKRHLKVMERVTELMKELIPDKRKPRHFRYRYSDDFRRTIDGVVLNLAASSVKFRDHPLLLGMVALRAAFTPEFLTGHQALASAVTDSASETFRLLRLEAGRSFHGGDPLQNEGLLRQLEKFDEALANFEFAWICDGTDPVVLAAVNEIQPLIELFIKAARWAVEQGYINSEDFANSEPEVMTTLPRLVVLFYLTEISADAQASRKYTVFSQHQSELDEALQLLSELEPPQREEIARRLCLKTEADDPQLMRLFRAIATAADQMQTNHPMESNYLMSHVCSSFEVALDAAVDSPPAIVGNVDDAHPARTGPVIWVPDCSSTVCTFRDCGREFSVLQRRHHCRACGGLFCDECTKQRLSLPMLGLHSPVRVCNACYDQISATRLTQNAPEWAVSSSYRCCSNGACREDFSVFRRRHHCRACGGVFCHGCSNYRAALPQFGYASAVRVCQYCHSIHGSLQA